VNRLTMDEVDLEGLATDRKVADVAQYDLHNGSLPACGLAG